MRFYLFLLIVGFVGCSLHRTYVDDTISERKIFEKNMKKKYGVWVAGDGGALMNCIEQINITFETNNNLTLEDLRFMIVGMYLEFLDQLNRNEKLKPYVEGNVFVPSNLELSIMCTKPWGGFHWEQGLSGVMFGKNTFVYKTVDPKTGRLTDFHRETWEEAVSIHMRSGAEKSSSFIKCSPQL